MTSVSACHIILTPTQPVGKSQRESNPRPPHQESRALPTELLGLPTSYDHPGHTFGANRVQARPIHAHCVVYKSGQTFNLAESNELKVRFSFKNKRS